MRLPKDRPLELADFRALEKGVMFTLYYHTFNRGEMIWIHDRVEDDRVWGAFVCGDGQPVSVGNYLYEDDGVVCCGSGAEPVWAGQPGYRGSPNDRLGSESGGCYGNNCEECLDEQEAIG